MSEVTRDAYGRPTGHRGDQADKKFDTNEQLRRQKFDAEHDQKMGASGIGGARKRTPQYLKDRDEAYKKASASGWGNQ